MFYTGASVSRINNRKGKPFRGYLQYKDPETDKWKKITKTFPDARTKTEAKAELAKWRAEMEAKAEIRDNGKRVRTAIAEYLTAQRNLNKISVVTYQNSTRLAETVIYPLIGDRLFLDLTKGEVQDFVNELAKRYKPSSARTIFSILSKTYKNALRVEEVLKDPTANVVLPRITDSHINYLNAEGRRKFNALMTKESPFYLPCMIAYYTGMRVGEICGLQWKDVNLVTNTISVTKTAKDYITDSGKHDVEISNPKTPSSVRQIPIIAALADILSEEARDRRPSTNDYIVAWRNPKLLSTSFLKWSTRNELYGEAGKPITMHGLRHTFATVGVQSGVDVKSLSAILGHSSTAMTLDVYASSDEQAKRYAMGNLGAFFKAEGDSDF